MTDAYIHLHTEKIMKMKLSEANQNGFRNYAASEKLYIAPNEWGETTVGTTTEFEAAIPPEEAEARNTGFYDWYRDTDTAETWPDYRTDLLDELIEIDIVDDTLSYYDATSDDGFFRIAVVDGTGFVTSGEEISPDDLPHDFDKWQTYTTYALHDCAVRVMSPGGE